MQRASLQHTTPASGLADILERVLDKGIVIAGDISVSIAEIQLLSIRVRLLVASVDKAMEIGINWWESDPYLSSRHQQLQQNHDQLKQAMTHAHALQEENRQLKARLERLEQHLLGAARPVQPAAPQAANASAAVTPIVQGRPRPTSSRGRPSSNGTAGSNGVSRKGPYPFSS